MFYGHREQSTSPCESVTIMRASKAAREARGRAVHSRHGQDGGHRSRKYASVSLKDVRDRASSTRSAGIPSLPTCERESPNRSPQLCGRAGRTSESKNATLTEASTCAPKIHRILAIGTSWNWAISVVPGIQFTVPIAAQLRPCPPGCSALVAHVHLGAGWQDTATQPPRALAERPSSDVHAQRRQLARGPKARVAARCQRGADVGRGSGCDGWRWSIAETTAEQGGLKVIF